MIHPEHGHPAAYASLRCRGSGRPSGQAMVGRGGWRALQRDHGGRRHPAPTDCLPGPFASRPAPEPRALIPALEAGPGRGLSQTTWPGPSPVMVDGGQPADRGSALEGASQRTRTPAPSPERSVAPPWWKRPCMAADPNGPDLAAAGRAGVAFQAGCRGPLAAGAHQLMGRRFTAGLPIAPPRSTYLRKRAAGAYLTPIRATANTVDDPPGLWRCPGQGRRLGACDLSDQLRAHQTPDLHHPYPTTKPKLAGFRMGNRAASLHVPARPRPSSAATGQRQLRPHGGLDRPG